MESDRIPAYSKSTFDIEVLYHDTWREMASASLRTDFAEDVINLEIAIGLDRVVEVWNSFAPPEISLPDFAPES